MRDAEICKDFNQVYTENPALMRIDDSWDGFKWLNVDDRAQSVFAFIRTNGEEFVVCVVNFTPVGKGKLLDRHPAGRNA